MPAALRSLGADDELVFVDYDDPDNCGAWVEGLGDDRVTVVVASKLPFFHVNHARNLGFKAAVCPISIFSDVDYAVSTALVEEARSLAPQTWLAQPDDVGSWGFIVVLRTDVLEVNGWDEAFVAYGCDDMAFRASLTLLGVKCQIMKARLRPVQREGKQVRMLGADINISAVYNVRLARALRMLHPYKQNISRNFGWGGDLICQSRARLTAVRDMRVSGYGALPCGRR